MTSTETQPEARPETRSGPDTRPDPPSVRIIAEIRRRIATGELRPGDRVPSTRSITREWGVAMATATKVLSTLGREGLVQVVPGVATVVAAPASRRSAGASRPAPGRGTPTARTDTRDPEHFLTRERIVRTAIAVADDEGMAALSMRRIAAELGVSAMSLYRYVPGKDELVALMADTVFGDLEPSRADITGWRARMETTCRVQWDLYRSHRWLAQAVSLTRPRPMPKAMAQIEWMMAEVEGLDQDEMLYIALTVIGFTRGAGTDIDSEVEAERSTGLNNTDWLRSQAPALHHVLQSGAFPMYSGVAARNSVFDLDTLFDFGLNRLLDGIGAFIRERTGRRVP
ncbi:GntR family transcriptional regulator [Embleya sp. NPDC008237]|uniref:GntR family transcriptional regulator n=1 Tax=Embleya sp. NPDC008237 TaxID=3363978 RepID=UPI0036E8D920